jgi:hypothetical protein
LKSRASALASSKNLSSFREKDGVRARMMANHPFKWAQNALGISSPPLFHTGKAEANNEEKTDFAIWFA